MGVVDGSEPEVGDERRRALRRRRRVEGGRHHSHKVRVTPEEEGQLVALALRYGVSVPKLLVDSALAGGAGNGGVHDSARQQLITELFAGFRQLAGIANNVNQIARAANVNGQVRADMDATLAAVRGTAERIDDLLDQLAAQR